MVPLGSDHPYDRVVRTIGGSNPRRPLAALASAPGEDDGWRICRGDLVGLNLAAPSAKNKICSLGGRIGGGRLT
jgi:hypothetical protein